jgi:hypothetical protein
VEKCSSIFEIAYFFKLFYFLDTFELKRMTRIERKTNLWHRTDEPLAGPHKWSEYKCAGPKWAKDFTKKRGQSTPTSNFTFIPSVMSSAIRADAGLSN